MHLVELFLPLTYPNGDAVPEAIFQLIESELTEVLGGVTEYARRSARGLWKTDHSLEADALVVFEVMTKDLDKDWWRDFRHRTQALLHQEKLLVRATVSERL